MPTKLAGSLFTGIRGLDKAVEALGFDVVWHTEINKDASKELERQRPDVPNYGDVTQIDYSQVEPVECLIGGGWPCQPFSQAGKGDGIEDPRYLWPEVTRALRSLRPRYFFMEQVADILDERRFPGVFSRCLADLAEAGMHARWGCLRSSDVGAPHGRKRLFLVAHARGAGARGNGRSTPAAQERLRRSEPNDGHSPIHSGAEAPTDTQSDTGRVLNGDGLQAPAHSTINGRQGHSEDDDQERTLAATGRSNPTGRGEASSNSNSAQRQGSSGGGHSGRDLAREVEALANTHCAGQQGNGRAGEAGRSEPAWDSRTFDWLDWEPAIRRWEGIVGMAPCPFVMVEHRGETNPRLNPELSAWMMYLDPPHLPRRAALRCIGNAVNPIQALVALQQLDAGLRVRGPSIKSNNGPERKD